ncbi:MarR family transcriptional regulator [Neomoorella humiferrea]|uniref:MarR family winged helix-turn-helix transcriptional regulator n=1 Tax=Neomoorella humiferrea TaxID=676965 RepID=UPI003D8A0558
MGGPQESTRELEYLLRQINHVINHSTRSYLAERGLTMPRFWVLSNMVADRPLTMGELQRRLLQAPGTVTGLVDGLVEEGLVRRWRDENDRRLVFLALTPEGERFLEEILQFRAAVLEKALVALDVGAIEGLNKELSLILKNLKNQFPCKTGCKADRGTGAV